MELIEMGFIVTSRASCVFHHFGPKTNVFALGVDTYKHNHRHCHCGVGCLKFVAV